MSESIHYPWAEQLPAEGHSLEVQPGLHWLRFPLPFALDHINLWLLADTHGWTLVDTGVGGQRSQALWQLLQQRVLANLPLQRIIVTHYHPDHIGSAAWLAERFACPVLMSEAEFLTAHAVWNQSAAWGNGGLARLFAEHGLESARIHALLDGGNGYRMSVPQLPAQFSRLIHGQTLRIGQHQWQVLTGYGHAPEHIALYCPEREVLISGDQVLPRISSNISVWPTEPEGDPLGLYLDSLQTLQPLPDSTLVLPSHGKPFTGLNARLAQLAAHHAERLQALEEACTHPRHATELLPVLFQRSLEQRQLFFAMGEAIAHLHYLHQRGRLQRQVRDGVWHFQRVR